MERFDAVTVIDNALKSSASDGDTGSITVEGGEGTSSQSRSVGRSAPGEDRAVVGGVDLFYLRWCLEGVVGLRCKGCGRGLCGWFGD